MSCSALCVRRKTIKLRHVKSRREKIEKAFTVGIRTIVNESATLNVRQALLAAKVENAAIPNVSADVLTMIRASVGLAKISMLE